MLINQLRIICLWLCASPFKFGIVCLTSNIPIQAVVVNKLTYESPGMVLGHGFTCAVDRERVNSFLRRPANLCYYPDAQSPSFDSFV